MGRRQQEDGDDHNQEGNAHHASLSCLVGRDVKNDEGKQKGDKQDEGWTKPTVSHPALEHLAETNHGSRW